ncbi:MAG: hypothetical protein LBP42_07985 [Treponema sp.]|jgi:hypothetical protein|nr:hypothetical protein [Treponema sp.]
MRFNYCIFFYIWFLCFELRAESLRVLVAGDLAISRENQSGASIPLSYVSSAIITLDRDTRFFKGIELELTVPQAFLTYQGSLAIAMYTELDRIPGTGAADVEGRQIFFEPISNKIQTIYQIPLRAAHGLRSSPYASIPTGVIPPDSFPLLFRILPVIKGLSMEIESMRFQLNAKPLLSDEGAVRIAIRYPEQLPEKPFTLLIDDTVIENFGEEQLLKEGEHRLSILSENYRNENRLFLIERGKILEIALELQDPTPIIIFEAPQGAQIFLDGLLLEQIFTPLPVEPGQHEMRFQLSDYSIIKSITVEKGKTYRASLTADVVIEETE